MATLAEDLKTIIDTAQAELDAITAPTPTVGDDLLTALTPVLTAAGWTPPAPAEDPGVEIPVTTS